MVLNLSIEDKERIASGDIETLKKVLVDCRLENIEHLTNNDKADIAKYQGIGQLVSDLLDIFQLKVCLKKD
jgi:hypothetical protein